REEEGKGGLGEGGDLGGNLGKKGSAVPRNRRRSVGDDTKPTFAFHAWIKENIQKNKPYDQFVREILTATGEEIKSPPVVWYRELKEASAQMEDAAQLFLGQRIGCAKWHHHPFAKWSQQDYWGMAAFFSRVTVKEPPPKKGKPKKGQPPEPIEPTAVLHTPGKVAMTNPRTGKAVGPTGLGSRVFEVSATDDPRHKLVE